MKFLKLMSTAALLTLAMAALVFAQEVVPPNPNPFDWEKVTTGLIAVVGYLATYLLRKVFPTLPRLLVYTWPFLTSAILQGLAQWQAHVHAGTVEALIAAVVSGALAVAFNEAKTTAAEHGLNG